MSSQPISGPAPRADEISRLRVAWGYYRRLFGVAFHGAWATVGWVSTGVALVIPLGLKVALSQHSTISKTTLDLVNDLVWVLPLSVFIVVFAVRLLLSPFLIFEQDTAKHATETVQAKQAAADMAKRRQDSPLALFFDPVDPTCVQRVVYSMSLVTMIRVGILHRGRERVERVGVALHAIKPPLPGVSMALDAGHENHYFPLADTRTAQFDVNPSPDAHPTVFVDILLQATDEHGMFHVARVLCCEPTRADGRDTTSTKLNKAADDAEITLRLDGPVTSPPMTLLLRREPTRGELLVIAPNPGGAALPSSWVPSEPVV